MICIIMLIIIVIILILFNKRYTYKSNVSYLSHDMYVSNSYKDGDLLGRHLKENKYYIDKLHIYEPLLKGTKRTAQSDKFDIRKYIDNSYPNNYRCMKPDPKNYTDLSMMASNGPPE